MKKNVIFWVGIENPDHKDKYGNYNYFEYSKNTWKHFCKRFDCHFVEFNIPIEKDLFKFRINWQKAIFCFDELEKQGVKYDQIALVDSSCMYKWDAPNFFELTERKFVGWRDTDNMRWTYDSIMGYKEFFDNFKLDTTKYINSGFIIFNESHKEFFQSFKQLYYDNIDKFCELQDKIVRKGNEQTPLNYWLQKNNIELKTNLPIAFKLTHLHRKEMFGYNWQLNEDNTPYFIKHGYNWIFSGLPKHDRSNIMKQVWDMVKSNYSYNVLDKVDHKNTTKYSTTRKFKEDLINYFNNHKSQTLVEFGCCHGDTTRILSDLFKTIYASDINKDNIKHALDKCKDVNNVNIEAKDVNSEWKYDQVDVLYLDALHDYTGVKHCLERVKNLYPNSLIVMDDYGHIMNTVKPNIDNLINNNEIEVLKWIGEDKGYTPSNGKTFIDKEGLVFRFK
tara:strand:- start:1029 stop:2369 length:1341 start_codon:yes stop_codon:yes gene_type:complete